LNERIFGFYTLWLEISEFDVFKFLVIADILKNRKVMFLKRCVYFRPYFTLTRWDH